MNPLNPIEQKFAMVGLGISSIATWIRAVEASFNVANTTLESQPTNRYTLVAQDLE